MQLLLKSSKTKETGIHCFNTKLRSLDFFTDILKYNGCPIVNGCMNQPGDFEISFITSADGVRIGYRKIGHGPALILLHGGLQSSLNFTGLAKVLANDFTVYVPDRRGRGLSDAYRDDEGLEAESGDLLALIRHTHAEHIFALSSGAIITLQAAIKERSLTKIALYEPPIRLQDDPFKKLGRDYEEAMRKGSTGKAFITIMKNIDDTSFSLLTSLPAFITAPLVSLMARFQAKSQYNAEHNLTELVPTFHYDLNIIRDSVKLLSHLGQVKGDVLLLEGGKSQPFLHQTIERLAASMPDAKRIKFPKQGHMAADNIGDPQTVAVELLKFFGGK